MRKAILVLAGGFCGTLLRYLLAAPVLSLARLGLPGAGGSFPYDVLAINLAGAFAIGLLYGLSDRGAIASPDVRLALGTGFLGAFTTFSTLAYGGDKLLLAGAWMLGLLYLGGSLLLGIVLARAGYFCAGALTRQWLRVLGSEAGARARRPA
jgi:CrcB protein